ncbi:MAG: hypothetical protein DRI44_02205 [Chlamydiae bacterium]|nr:MAG: hypothetical protein DRI44_02205 [Chlamydiota bacterium]
MADSNFKIKPVKQGKKIVLTLECRTHDDKWISLGYLQPKVIVSGLDTLKLDIFTPKVEWHEYAKKGRSMILTGNDGIARIKTGIHFHSQDILRIETRISFSRPVCLEIAKDNLTLPDFNIDSSWTPHQTPLQEMLIGDMVFRSPGVIVQDADRVLGVFPNLRTLRKNRTIPYAMNFSVRSKEISFGCVPYKLSKNTYLIHNEDDTINVPRSTVSYSYYIYFKSGCLKNEGYRHVVHRMGQLNFSIQSKNASAQKVTFEKYCDYAGKYSVKQLQKDNIALHFALQTAFGSALLSKRKNEPIPAEVENIIKSALTTPQKNGLFKVMRQDNKWINGSVFSNMPPRYKDESVRLADLSNVCYFLCRFYNEIEKKHEILNFVTVYAERLILLQKHGGHIPAWVNYETGKSQRFCNKSAEVSVHTTFLSELAKIKPEKRYLSCARRAANFIIHKIYQTGRWENTELFYTTSPQWKYKKPKRKDGIQESYSVSVHAIRNAADALLKLYNLTGTSRYLRFGEKILAQLSLYQQIWQPPFIDLPCSGGFGSMNTDIQWLDSVQSLSAKTYFDYYKNTGKKEYFTRGIAALRASFVLMNCPENEEFLAQIKDMGEIDKGYIFPYCFPSVNRDKIILPEAEDFNFASGQALCVTEEILNEYGDLYVDTKRRKAFGINGLKVKKVESDLAGLAVYGEDFLGKARTISVKTDTGILFTSKIKKSSQFEIQV